ncbi:uncharacterized protein LOC130998219 [Salvia miltiorrhiza]|uniref:uncharacterized protein LOC130998219 n=1 Tax=Salvia miltiorrhiza TaxID=226208 RepID=UPI0025ABC088|nr:uncharacterized protein LOC130998219 [Salvia miltiorrhiza]
MAIFGSMEFKEAGFTRRDLLTELDEWRNEAYESSRIYNERAKKFHDLSIRTKELKPGDELQSRWTGSYVVHKRNWNGTYELFVKDGTTFTVNGHCLKPYFKSNVDRGLEVVKFNDP